MSDPKKTADDWIEETRERFHAHLDECPQCRNSPMRLCRVGDGIIQSVGERARAQEVGDEE